MILEFGFVVLFWDDGLIIIVVVLGMNDDGDEFDFDMLDL